MQILNGFEVIKKKKKGNYPKYLKRFESVLRQNKIIGEIGAIGKES
jgi:hypothetical protein